MPIAPNTTAVECRPPSVVMRLARMGSFHQSRLSFMRILLRRLKSEGWTFSRPAFDIDARGVGHAVYSAHGPQNTYSLIAFANDLAPEKRSDRVIATEWDCTFTLFDGVPSNADIERLRANVPRQEAGRISDTELSLSRANRSVRMFDYVVGCLARGEQPDVVQIDAVGYLMRTTAVYGSGKFGAADRETICDRPEFHAPFQVEMLSVFLTRAFVLDLVEHIAASRSPKTAVPMAPDIRRRFGIGNSTGLGMAPFLLNHPALLHKWIAARETALARVRSIPKTDDLHIDCFCTILNRACQNVADWHSQHPLQIEKLGALNRDLHELCDHIASFDFQLPQPWNAIWLWAEAHLGAEGQELLLSLLLEPHGDVVDDLTNEMGVDEAASFRLDGAMELGELRDFIAREYDWALAIDWTDENAQARAWYVSEAKLEPRLGERFAEPISEYEQPLSPARDIARCHADMESFARETTLAEFLLSHPQHRHSVRRLQIVMACPFAEIRDNTIAQDVLPIDMLRAKLSFFGACHFDPRSDRWVRINMFRNAPFPHELAGCDADDWTYPTAQGNG